MSSYSKENYAIDDHNFSSMDEYQGDFFAPTVESLKNAHDVVRRYERGRRSLERRNIQVRETGNTSPVVLDMMIAVGDNIIPLRGRVWAGPSSRIARSRHSSRPYILSPASRARRASTRRNALRASRYVTVAKLSRIVPADPVIFDDVQSDMLERLGVMAIQGLAVLLGFIGLLALLRVF
jgi:hypothetical protein